MFIMILLIIAWLIAPIVLGIICITQRGKIRRLENENYMLRKNGVGSDAAHTSSAVYHPDRDINTPQYCPPPSADMNKTPVSADSAYASVWGADKRIDRAQPPAPTEKVTDTVRPAYTAPPVREKKAPSAINVILILGALFITLAGFVFAAAAWGRLGTVFKSVVLLSFSAVFFIIHSLAERKLKLEATGKAFYALGSAFLPAAAAAAGYLRVFGDYFSFYGDGHLLILALMAALTAGCLVKGAYKYNSRSCARAAYGAVTCFVACIVIHAGQTTAVSAAMLSIYALVVLLIEPMITERAGENVILREFGYYTVGNTWVLAAISLFLSGGEAFFVMPTLVFSAAFFISALKSSNASAGTCACAAYLIVGAYLGIRPDSFDGIILVGALVTVVYTCLSLLDMIPGDMRRIAEKIRSAASVAVIAAGLIGTLVRSSGYELSVLISAAAVFLQLMVVTFRSRDFFAKLAAFGSYIWLAAEVCKGIFAESGFADMPPVFAAAVFAYFLFIKLTPLKKIYYDRCIDIMAFAALLAAIPAYYDNIGTAGGLIIRLMCVGTAFISWGNFGKYLAPVSIFALFFPLYDENSLIIFAAALLAYFAAVKLTPLKKAFYGRAVDVLTFIALFICIWGYGNYGENAFGGMIIWLFCIAAAFISGTDFAFGRNMAPVGMFALCYPLIWQSELSDENVFAITGAVYCVAAALMLIKPLKKFSSAFSTGIPFLLAAELTMSAVGLKDAPVIASVTFMILIYSAVKLIFADKNGYYPAHGYFFLGVLCYAALEAGRLLINGAEAAVFPAAAMLVLTGVYIMPSETKGRFSDCLGRFLMLVMPVYGIVIAFMSAFSEYRIAALLVAAWALAACGCAVSVMNKKALLIYIHMGAMHICTFAYAMDISEFSADFSAVLIILLCCTAGRLIFGEKALVKKAPAASDFLTVTSYFGSAPMLFGGGKYSAWLAFVTAGLITLNLIRRGHSDKLNRWILTAAAASVMPIWWSQPFFTPPEVIETELFLLPAFIVCILLGRIHRESPSWTGYISFGFAIAALARLFFDAAGTEYPEDAVILGAVIVTMLAFSFMRRRKKWFVLAVVSAAAEALLLTVKLWNSKLWWLYLLIAGIILIGIGMINEMNRQKRKNGERSEFDRFMSEWWTEEPANKNDGF